MDFSNELHPGAAARPLCHCLGISAEEVRSCITEENLATVRSVTKSCGAGGGCTSCHRHIKRMLHEHALQQRSAEAPAFGFA